MMDLDAFVAPAPGAVGRLMEDEAVVVVPERGRVKVLNEVGARIWALVNGARSVREIAAVICSEYDIEPSVAESDTLAFLTELLEHGAVTLSLKNT